MARKRKASPRPSNWVFVSDLHCGCQLGLCPPAGAHRDEGGHYDPNAIQRTIWEYWEEFWGDWVPGILKGQAYGVVLLGDCLDGTHHASTHQITHNPAIQAEIAEQVLTPVVAHCRGWFYLVRGTEAHVGPSGAEEERLARALGAKRNQYGQYARYDLWLRVGSGLVHALHHIGTTGSSAYEATAVHKELTESFTEAARWGERAPDVILRAHRHRFLKTEIATDRGNAQAVVLPGWQAKTPFAYRIAGARLAPPQFGGVIVRQGDEGLYIRHRVWTIARSGVV